MQLATFQLACFSRLRFIDTDLKRVVGRGTRDEKNGRARLLPSRNGSEWRLAIGKWLFWRAVLPHCRKFRRW